ncbi:MAG: TIGR02217 family protein [Hyphomicrobiales bacterium]|nr:TIGR02217 family protein [Hyphomicrobiales bacterium]
MTTPVAFHDVRLQNVLRIAASGSLEYNTQLMTTASGFEHRNARWTQPRRRYEVHIGARPLSDLRSLQRFFRDRHGRLHGFLWRDILESRSSKQHEIPRAKDQPMKRLTADGRVWSFFKGLRNTSRPELVRRIFKPVPSSVQLAHNRAPIPLEQYVIHAAHGVISFRPGHYRTSGVTAGFEFDVPVRFDIDRLEIRMVTNLAGTCEPIPLVEIRLAEISPDDIS